MRLAPARVAALAALAVLVPAQSAPAKARTATAAEERAIRSALPDGCRTTPRHVQVAISGRDPRYAIYNWDDGFRATTVCTAILRRSTRAAKRWRVREFRVGGAAFDRSIRPCPRELPRDLRRTVYPRGAADPLVYCGN